MLGEPYILIVNGQAGLKPGRCGNALVYVVCVFTWGATGTPLVKCHLGLLGTCALKEGG